MHAHFSLGCIVYKAYTDLFLRHFSAKRSRYNYRLPLRSINAHIYYVYIIFTKLFTFHLVKRRK